MKFDELIKDVEASVDVLSKLREPFISGSLTRTHFKLFTTACKRAKIKLEMAAKHVRDKRNISEKERIWARCFPQDDFPGAPD